MNDLIDRQETIKQFCKQDCGCDPKDCPDKTCHEVEIIESVPTHQTPSNTLGALDCIDRHKAINIRFSEGFDHDGILYVPWKDVKAHLKELPSVKPEFQEWQKIILSKLMVIRCKDCKNWVIGKTTKNYPNPYICDLHSFMHGFERSALPEDYCSWAELKGEEAKKGGDKGC